MAEAVTSILLDSTLYSESGCYFITSSGKLSLVHHQLFMYTGPRMLYGKGAMLKKEYKVGANRPYEYH